MKKSASTYMTPNDKPTLNSKSGLMFKVGVIDGDDFFLTGLQT
jgi:hypothetical protein